MLAMVQCAIASETPYSEHYKVECHYNDRDEPGEHGDDYADETPDYTT